MGRLPTHFAGQLIRQRYPYTVTGSLLVAVNTSNQQFPEATYLINSELPFEIHSVLPRVTPFDNATPPLAISMAQLMLFPELPDLLLKTVRLRIEDSTKSNIKWNRNSQIIDGMVKQNTKVWDLDEPVTLVKQEQLYVFVDNLLPAGGFAFPNQGPTVANLQVEVTFEGFQLILSPPSETR